MKEFKNQKELFLFIWNDRPHVSEISGLALPGINSLLWINCFAHILPKGKYPAFKLNPDNVILVTPAEHSLDHFSNRNKIEDYCKVHKCKWLFETRKLEMIKKYNEFIKVPYYEKVFNH